jgi:hypothetical protein
MLLLFLWELVRQLSGLPPFLILKDSVTVAAHPLLVPLLMAGQASFTFFFAFGCAGLLALFRRVLRRPGLAVALVFVLILALYSPFSYTLWDLVSYGIGLALALFALHRWGVIACVATLFFAHLPTLVPLGFPPSSPFATSSALLVIFALIIFTGAAVSTLAGARKLRAARQTP